MKRHRSNFLLLLTPVLASSTPIKHVPDLIEWLRSRGGTYNAKLEIRHSDPSDPLSHMGVFARTTIKSKELLLDIPPDCIITSGKVVQEPSPMECGTVKNLIREMKLGNESKFAPYVNYLASQPHGQLPSAWSKLGKELLLDILDFDEGYGVLPPADAVGWIDHEWRENCKGPRDAMMENAALLAVQRGWDDWLIPIYDMFNHRNGRWLNTESNSVRDSDRVRVRASREIKKGEEIYTTYNFCADCGGRVRTYGTPEMLRDYGFVEQFPQRWFLHEKGISFEIDENENGGDQSLSVHWILKRPSDEDIQFLGSELQRLSEFSIEEEKDTIPENEWTVIKSYYDALVTAFSTAIESTMSVNAKKCLYEGGECPFPHVQRYDELEEKEDGLDYRSPICNSDEIFEFKGYNLSTELIQSPYQEINFFEDPRNNDTCFELDAIVQICSSYRPHYHEMVVHHTARFLPLIKRVVFVGGGDSMLLHEIIKYPTLDLVVGLELDQKVTRSSFRHFGTQPHWDNPKVQWWYGDATKSLLMLPKDYFGSFDMVLVDLSETVMSFRVTEELDVMDALSLLLKPGGIFVKNELYLEALSDIFYHTVQIHYYDVPVICSQALILGSHEVDFLHHELRDHGVDNLYVKPLEQTGGKFEYFHDYTRNKTAASRFCKNDLDDDEDKITEDVQQKKSPGILMILEAEKTGIDLTQLDKIQTQLVEALLKAELSVVSTFESQHDTHGSIFIVLREGYIVAQTWPDHQYCGLDIHLWSSFEKHDNIKALLLAELGNDAKSSSSYRIVAGGMLGVSTWQDDEKNRGPRVTRLCNGDNLDDMKREKDVAQADMHVALEETLTVLTKDEKIMVAVVCEKETIGPCPTLQVVENMEQIEKVVTLYACPSLVDEPSMIQCEKDTLQTMKKAVNSEGRRIEALIFDPRAPFQMGQIIHKLSDLRRNRRKIFIPHFSVVTLMRNEGETWKRHIIDRFRQTVAYEPAYRAEILFNTTMSHLELCVFTSSYSFFDDVVNASNSIRERTGLVASVKNVIGGMFNYVPNFKPSQFYLHGDYDQVSSLEQWRNQQPMGQQKVFQLETVKGKILTLEEIKNAVTKLASMDNKSSVHEYDELGKGYLGILQDDDGYIIVLWDGMNHVDINIFTTFENLEFPKAILTFFRDEVKGMDVLLRDEQPRGYGRVVNFRHEIDRWGMMPTWAF